MAPGTNQTEPHALPRTRQPDGDGWIECACGGQHWGIHGAAGLFLRHVDQSGQERILLTHRQAWTDGGETCSIPGGARNSWETARHAGLRETDEELGVKPDLKIVSEAVDDHGSWSYTTVIADVDHMFEFGELSENDGAGWYTPDEIDQLTLHPGFQIFWDDYRRR